MSWKIWLCHKLLQTDKKSYTCRFRWPLAKQFLSPTKPWCKWDSVSYRAILEQQELEVLISALYPQIQKLTMSLRNAIMRFSGLGFRSDKRIELESSILEPRDIED